MTVPAGETAAASTASTTATATTSTAGTSEGKVEIKLGDQVISVDPNEISEWKNAFEKKTTNADKFFTKRSQELAAELKATKEERAQINELMAQLKNGQAKAPAQAKVANILDYDGDDPEVLSAISTVEKIIEKKMGPELDALKKSLQAREEQDAKAALTVRANQIKTEAEKILSTSQLDNEDRGFFVNAFLGKYDVDRIPTEDTYTQTGDLQPGLFTLFTQEMKAYEASLKRRGLLANKEYVDKKTETKTKLSTDTKGSSGSESDSPDFKSMKGREKKNAKLKMLSEIVNKHLSPPK